MQQFRGECLCGAVRYRIRATGAHTMYLCHCTRCRKETGTVHGANVFFRSGELELERGVDNVTRFALAGTRKARVFCTTCGSPMPRVTPGGMIVLPAGSLDDGSALKPTAHIFCASAASWEAELGEVPRRDEGPS